jgi:hypothetical protein
VAVEPLITPLLAIGAAALVLVLLWSLVIQQVATSRQRKALATVDESLALQRRTADLQLEANVLAEKSLRNQEEILRLLWQLVGDRPGVERERSDTSIRTPQGH